MLDFRVDANRDRHRFRAASALVDLAVTTRRRLAITRPWPLAPATSTLVGLLVAAAVLLLYVGRRLTFFYDEWDFIINRRGSGLSTYLDPHNGHLSLFPVTVYKALFAVVGLRHYTPYRLTGIAVHLLCAVLLYVLIRRRIGPWLALVPAILLLFLGAAFQDILWPFQIGYLGSVAGGLGALAVLEGSPRRDWLAATLLVWSVVSSGVGVAFALACAALLIASRADWRRLWVVAVPAIVYLLWYAGWGTGEQTSTAAILGAPQYVANAAGGAAAGIAGLDDASWGPPMAVAASAIIALSWWARRVGPPSPMLLAALVGALSFWVLTAVTRADHGEPAASRYIYIGAVFIMLIAAEARLGAGVRGGWLALSGILIASALVGNLNVLRGGEGGLRAADSSVRASLAAVQIAAPVVSPAFEAEPTNAPQLTAGPYLAAVRDLGSPALTTRELAGAPELIREHSDTVLEHAERLAAVPYGGPSLPASPPTVEGSTGGRLLSRSACTVIVPAGGLGSLDLLSAPGASVVVRGTRGSIANVYLRRFASTFPGAPFATVAQGAREAVHFPVDLAPRLPWHVQVVAARPTAVCRA